MKNGKAVGVALESGEEIYADLVVSNLDPKRTFLKLMDEKDLEPSFVESARNFKIRGSSGKLNIALDGLPEFPQLGKDNRLFAATCTSWIRLSAWNVPSTTGKTARGLETLMSTC